MPWIKTQKAPSRTRIDTQGYARNETLFLYHLAKEIFSRLCLEPILADISTRSQFLRLVGELLRWTFQEITPPFAASRRDRNGSTPFAWVSAFSASCGELCAHLTAEESKTEILAPIWAQDTDTALLMMQDLMRAFMIKAFLAPGEINSDHIALWSDMFEWLLANPEWKRGRDREHLDRQFASCAFNTLFCIAPYFSPLICGIESGWPHLGRFLPIVERAFQEFGVNATLCSGVTTFLKKGGFDLLPEPALAWLYGVVVARKSDQPFWQANGEDTVELLKQLISQKSGILSHGHLRSITLIADILVDNGVRGAGFLQQELLRRQDG